MENIFISYSHCDRIYLEKLKRHFKPFSKKISFWDDSKILAGQKWKNEIFEALMRCKVAILLVSADFFNSDFIEKVELPHLLEAAEKRGVVILSVILKPCLFDEYDSINKYQAINSPSETIIQMKEFEQEEIWVKLVKRVSDILKEQ